MDPASVQEHSTIHPKTIVRLKPFHRLRVIVLASEELGIWERFTDSKTITGHILANLANVRLHSQPPSRPFGIVRPNAFEFERAPDLTVFRMEARASVSPTKSSRISTKSRVPTKSSRILTVRLPSYFERTPVVSTIQKLVALKIGCILLPMGNSKFCQFHHRITIY